MPYLVDIPDYKPFYIQTDNDTAAIDTAAEWGLTAQTNPYPSLPTPKDPYSNDFYDEDGEDEYTTDMHYESFTFDVGFYVKTFDTDSTLAVDLLRSQMNGFFEHIRTGEFKVYDSYTGLGRQKVRYAGYEEGEFKSRKDWARLMFTVTFKVNDPITAMTYSDGQIKAISTT